MAGFIVKKFTTVIMDGSDKSIVKDITGVINMMTKERRGKAICRSLDKNHPTMKVIETYTTSRTYNMIREAIEEIYPGLCIFNPIM